MSKTIAIKPEYRYYSIALRVFSFASCLPAAFAGAMAVIYLQLGNFRIFDMYYYAFWAIMCGFLALTILSRSNKYMRIAKNNNS